MPKWPNAASAWPALRRSDQRGGIWRSAELAARAVRARTYAHRLPAAWLRAGPREMVTCTADSRARLAPRGGATRKFTCNFGKQRGCAQDRVTCAHAQRTAGSTWHRVAALHENLLAISGSSAAAQARVTWAHAQRTAGRAWHCVAALHENLLAISGKWPIIDITRRTASSRVQRAQEKRRQV